MALRHNPAPAPLSVDEITREVARLWLPDLAEQDWVERWRTIREIIAQLRDDIADETAARTVAAQVVAELVGSLPGSQSVTTEAQAMFYGLSADAEHRQAAEEWFKQPAASNFAIEHRAAPRRLVDEEGDLTVDHRRIPCTVVDLSTAGALVECRHPLMPGMSVLLSWEGREGRHRSVPARVVRTRPNFAGLAFTEQQPG